MTCHETLTMQSTRLVDIRDDMSMMSQTAADVREDSSMMSKTTAALEQHRISTDGKLAAEKLQTKTTADILELQGFIVLELKPTT